MVNLTEKMERTTTGSKGRGEVGKVTGMVVDVSTMDILGKGYGAFGGWQLEMCRYCWWLVG